MTRGPTAGTVLIVEEHAHWSIGHFPVRFAQLADGYTSLGYDVEVLSRFGWWGAGTPSGAPQSPLRVHRYGALARSFRRLAGKLRSFDRGAASGRLARRLGDVVAIGAVAGATRWRRRRMTREPEIVVVLGWAIDPNLLASLAGPGNWLLNQFQAPGDVVPWSSGVVRRVLVATAQRAERRRRGLGGRFRVAAADEGWVVQWRDRAPALDPLCLPIAGARTLPRVREARAQLGLEPARRIALLLGTRFDKDPHTAIEAFAGLDGWTLVIAGTVNELVPPAPTGDSSRVRFPGHVTDATRDLLLSAADLMVLSFVPGYRPNSGTLMDAISVGVPVVCSTSSAASEMVARYALGTTFTAGDAASLADAVRRAPDRIDPDDLARARTECSNTEVARRQLAALGVVLPSDPDSVVAEIPDVDNR